MGYAGNSLPSYIVPTVIASNEQVGTAASQGVDDLMFLIGDDAITSKQYQINYPVRHGLVDNWTHMEKYWQMSIFKYLRCEPEDHYFLLVRKLIYRNTYFKYQIIVRMLNGFISQFDRGFFVSNRSGIWPFVNFQALTLCIQSFRLSPHWTLQRTENTPLKLCSRLSTFLDCTSPCKPSWPWLPRGPLVLKTSEHSLVPSLTLVMVLPTLSPS